MSQADQDQYWIEACRRIETAKLSDAVALDLSNLNLTDIPDSLAKLDKLEQLDLDRNQITAIPDWLGQLTNLEFLFLEDNQITAVPDYIGQLTNLRHLILSSNRIIVVPDSLSQITNLQTLSLGDNQITAIPDSLGLLTNLETLYLENNQITAIPDSLGLLTNLRLLDLENNQITAVPDSLSQLTNLRWLHLSNNQITAVPDSFSQLTNLQGLYLHNNPGLGIPSEILGPTWKDLSRSRKQKPPQEILNYIKKADDARPLNEAKLILVGPGAVGKTSLVKTLITGKFNKKEKTTEGIKIDDWPCKLSRKETATVHIWDFGGQELMHATHQFFLTQRSLYLLVLNRRLGNNDREADYWLRLIRAFGGPDAPVIVVLNKQKSEPFDVNRGSWLERYASNIKAFIQTDCEIKKSVKALQTTIQHELSMMESLKTKFPRRWFSIKNELSQMKTDFLTFDKYRETCRKFNENSDNDQRQLAGFLHDLGIALNYSDDPRLRFNYVLKPEWVTQGIYALLHAFVGSKGLFTRHEAAEVLLPKKYDSDATDFILGLMEKFELCFALEDRQKRILIPELLADQQPEAASEFEPAKCLNFGYQYPVLPEGLLPRFIVRTHHLSRPDQRWKSGVILQDETGGARALVRSEAAENRLRVHIAGTQSAQQELLGIIRYNFEVIHSGYEFKPSALVYPEAAPENPLKVTDLEALEKNNALTAQVVLPDGNVIYPKVADLMSPIQANLEPLQVFLSYSHLDEKYEKELRKRLLLLERNGMIRTWVDRSLLAGERWEERILQELNEADVVICQLSPDFLASEFCAVKELRRAMERRDAGEIALAAYVLRTCDRDEIPELNSIQLLPTDAKPMRDWKDRDKYWQAVVEGIKAAIKNLQNDRQKQQSQKKRA